jgi:hypothetical protein
MMKFTVGIKVIVVLLFSAGVVYVSAFSSGPPPTSTGAPLPGGMPPELTCDQAGCHNDRPLNPDVRGVIALSGMPDNYIPGRRYTLQFSIMHPDSDRRRWGFQLTAISQTDFAPAGNIVVTDPVNTQVIPGGPDGLRQYIQHTLRGTARGQTGGNRWTFDWVAPSTNAGDVGFYAAGNASNANNANTGDKIYTKSPAPLAVVKGQLNFSEVAAQAQIASDAGGSGVAWGDYNDDGKPDVYIARAGQDLLYRNNGDGTFTDVAQAVGITETATGQAAVWLDYDGDGDADLFVANADGPDALYRNNGDGTLTNVADLAGVTGSNDPSRAVASADLNGDGPPDLIVITDGRDLVYKNQGDGTFVEVGQTVGIAGDGVGYAVAIGDYTGDGKPDVFVAGEGTYLLYRNAGDGSFTEVSAMAGINAGGASGRAAAWLDYNVDGKPDLIVINDGSTILYRNQGDGTFANVTSEAGLSGGAGRAVAVMDYDGDGDADVFVANIGQDFLYRNNGNGTFNQVAPFSGLTDTASGRAAAWGDFNKDGKPDLFVANAEGRDFLYQNPGR